MTASAPRMLAALPAIYRKDSFLGTYLAAFEQELLDLESRIGTIATLFDPQATPAEFLEWLSSWVAYAARADIDENRWRNFIASIVPLYRRRGTPENLQELLRIFVNGLPTIEEDQDPARPHYFKVIVNLADHEVGPLQRNSAIARALIELEKPAHTEYDLEPVFLTLQIGVTSHVGVDTLLGTGGPRTQP